MKISRIVAVVVAAAVVIGTWVVNTANPAPAAVSVVSVPAAVLPHIEGDVGTSIATITASLNVASAGVVTVHYATVNGTATVASGDYVGASGTLSFASGELTKSIDVTVNGDIIREDYQAFSVKLSLPVNATLGNATQVVQILNDDKPTLSLTNVAASEGGSAAFTAKLNQRYFQAITLNAQTTNGSAVAPNDYVPVNAGVVTFPAGTYVAPISIPIVADTSTEPAETFSLTVSGASVVAGATKVATIASQLCVAQAAPATYTHVVVVVMENHTYSSVIGAAAAPWLTGLAKGCGTATAYAQAGSPSRPNYIAMAAGDVFDCAGANSDPIANNCHPSSGTVFKQVIDTGGTAVVYGEAMVANCDATSHGLYAVKHNAWPYFPAEAALCQQFNQPLPGALDVNNLPTLLEIMPDLCHDTHDCSVATGDAWLAQYLQPVLDSPTYLSGQTAVIVTYDEYTNLPNAFAARSVNPATKVTAPTTHYALLRTVEDMLGLTPLGQAATAIGHRSAMHL